ncbi:HK97 family phage prohead protease [Absicoccus intestinalis]|uniref:HK97 family phage prohead protease n=1 Tax=Absicoccus intestinalis TaxID=2926319 RepID=A0ABU4WMB6_9FIRM|nr:HK97 family phage prohead protease [Absicoccus sp. CLA-KB-P134]MDX8417369.1 HK97 family phage prohead protease [Absicoccus sp. CLA-KB-P134]
MAKTDIPQTRMMAFQMNQDTEQKRIESDFYVEGYATTFEPYVLFHDDNGNPIYERISPQAFDGARMDDVILQYDHEGRVFARQSNGTLGLEVNDKGLFVWADLSKTEGARQLYEDIRSGMVNKMSWRFLIAPNGDTFDASSRTFVVNKVSDVFDVSAVSIPANNQTSISARKKNIEELEAKVKKAQELKRKKLELKLKLGGL